MLSQVTSLEQVYDIFPLEGAEQNSSHIWECKDGGVPLLNPKYYAGVHFKDKL